MRVSVRHGIWIIQVIAASRAHIAYVLCVRTTSKRNNEISTNIMVFDCLMDFALAKVFCFFCIETYIVSCAHVSRCLSSSDSQHVLCRDTNGEVHIGTMCWCVKQIKFKYEIWCWFFILVVKLGRRDIECVRASRNRLNFLSTEMFIILRCELGKQFLHPLQLSIELAYKFRSILCSPSFHE